MLGALAIDIGPETPERLAATGIWAGDAMPAVAIAEAA
jgi:hypothetical protein